MRFLISGATGLVGKRLIEKLFERGHQDIHILSRDPKKVQNSFPIKSFSWNPEKGEIDENAFKNVDIVIHLAGESVAEGRWTKSKKEKILNSRTQGTSLLIKTIKNLEHHPKKFISASAIGIYGNRGDEKLDSSSNCGDDFLADVCKKWEEHTHGHTLKNMTSHSIRVGIVLSKLGGALKKMLPPFKAGVAGKLGNGHQYMSWIHIDDLVSQFIFLSENDCKNKIYNGVTPNPVTNNEFTKILGSVLRRPTLFPVPSIALKTIFGEMSCILLNGQRVLPKEFLEEGFKFKYPDLKTALENILNHDIKGEEVLKRYQWIEDNSQNVFPFFSNEKNLEKITPPFLNFKVVGKNTKNIGKGTLIDYKLKVHGIPLKWQSEITSFENEKSFVDIQTKGPYKKWEHTHDFISFKNGTLIKDKIVYKVPFGSLGKIFAGSLVKKDLDQIFNYRTKIISKEFKR